jgi:hypothetical protein
MIAQVYNVDIPKFDEEFNPFKTLSVDDRMQDWIEKKFTKTSDEQWAKRKEKEREAYDKDVEKLKKVRETFKKSDTYKKLMQILDIVEAGLKKADDKFKSWDEVFGKMTADKKAADELTAWIDAHGGVGVAERDDLIAYAYALTSKYGEASGAYTAQYYDDMANLSKVYVPHAEVAELPSYGEVAKAINGTIKRSSKSSYIGSTSGRLVKQVSADTLQKNALRDGAEWAWVPAGDTCVFCLTLASRGWQTASKKALRNGHAEHIHANCDCTYAVRFDKNTTVEGYEPEKYLEIYENAEGDTPEEKINSMRRIQYRNNKNQKN